jgi:hypothetical protein
MNEYIIINTYKLDLTQMIKFFMVEPIHPGSNLKFNVNVIYLRLIIFSVIYDVLIDSKTFFDQLRESQN